MQAVRVDDDRWIIYDTDQRLAVLVSLSQLQAQEQLLSDEVAALDVSRDDQRLLAWAREVGWPMSLEGQHVLQRRQELALAQQYLQAIREAGGDVGA